MVGQRELGHKNEYSEGKVKSVDPNSDRKKTTSLLRAVLLRVIFIPMSISTSQIETHTYKREDHSILCVALLRIYLK